MSRPRRSRTPSTRPSAAAQSLAKTEGSLTPPNNHSQRADAPHEARGLRRRPYEYDHDAPDAFSGQNYWPDALGRRVLYEPVERGFERELKKRLDYWARPRKERGRE